MCSFTEDMCRLLPAPEKCTEDAARVALLGTHRSAKTPCEGAHYDILIGDRDEGHVPSAKWAHGDYVTDAREGWRRTGGWSAYESGQRLPPFHMEKTDSSAAKFLVEGYSGAAWSCCARYHDKASDVPLNEMTVDPACEGPSPTRICPQGNMKPATRGPNPYTLKPFPEWNPSSQPGKVSTKRSKKGVSFVDFCKNLPWDPMEQPDLRDRNGKFRTKALKHTYEGQNHPYYPRILGARPVVVVDGVEKRVKKENFCAFFESTEAAQTEHGKELGLTLGQERCRNDDPQYYSPIKSGAPPMPSVGVGHAKRLCCACGGGQPVYANSVKKCHVAECKDRGVGNYLAEFAKRPWKDANGHDCKWYEDATPR